ncbi:Uncharacterised protein [Vibrio cholerae]|nr:Uncharacterised protein [Vibrio cholerae]
MRLSKIGHARQRGETGIFTLPPVTTFVVLGDKETGAFGAFHPFDILTRVPKRVGDLLSYR